MRVPVLKKQEKSSGVDDGLERDPPAGQVVSVAGQSQQEAPAGQGAHVVVAALDFIPGIALDPVMAIPDRFHDFQPLVHHAFIDQVRGHLVLDARPYLVAVDERQARPAPMGPRAQEKPRLTIQDVGPLRVRVSPKVRS